MTILNKENISFLLSRKFDGKNNEKHTNLES